MFDTLFNSLVEKKVTITSTVAGGFTFGLLETSDGRKVAQQVVSTLQSYFSYPGTKCVLDLYAKENNRDMSIFSKDVVPIQYKHVEKKQTFPFSYCIVTSDESFYESAKKELDITFLQENESLDFLNDYELVLCIDCPQVSWHISHSKDITAEDAYIIHSYEKALQLHSLFNACKDHTPLAKELLEAVDTINPQTSCVQINYSELVETINKKLASEIDALSFSASDILTSLSSGELPATLVELIEQTCEQSNIPLNYVNMCFPLTLNDEAISLSQSENVKNKAYDAYRLLLEKKEILLQLDSIISHCHAIIVLHDFICGIKKFSQDFDCHIPKTGTFALTRSLNLLIANPQPITYRFDSYQSLILTGANSGGKTTLLEHIIQVYVLYSLCLPTSGEVIIDTSVKSIYYFAKNKGGAKKGAFEQLLHKLSQVHSHSLILADEMEAVTEPSVAASIMSTTLSFFHTKECRMVLATHLGKILQPLISDTVRVDGIVAKGLDENQNVIIDHNPVMGKIAESTPELIVQKMACKKKNEYLHYLAESFN